VEENAKKRVGSHGWFALLPETIQKTGGGTQLRTGQKVSGQHRKPTALRRVLGDQFDVTGVSVTGPSKPESVNGQSEASNER
jgi:hypothetical protein